MRIKISHDDKNFNRHTEDGMALLEKSVNEIGVIEAITVSGDNKIISGNARKETFDKVLGEDAEQIVIETDGTKQIVIKRTDIDSNTEKFYRAAILANTTAKKNISLDEDLIKEIAVEEFGIDVEELGVETISIENDVTDDDFEPDEENEIRTDIKRGDLFEIKQNGLTHRLLCGDSTKKEDIEKLMNGRFADMIFTDPPFDMQDMYSKNIFNAAAENCHIFIMNSDRLLIDDVNNAIEFFKKFFAVEFRQSRLVSNNQPMTRIDIIAEFNKGKSKFTNQFDAFSTLIECSKIHSDKIENNFGHKQAKRIELPAAFITHYSQKRELIADFFAGSGSTLIAAHQLERVCYLNEFEPKCCQIILDRFRKSYPDCSINKITG
jgi:16S rRNA G966 N2-methylase RsmD